MEIRVTQKAIIHKDERILVIKRVKGGGNGGKWDFPGGKVETGENLILALAREVAEETGLVAKILKPMATQAFETPGRYIVGILYKAQYISGDVKLSSEHDEYKWIEPQQLAELDLQGWLIMALGLKS